MGERLASTTRALRYDAETRAVTPLAALDGVPAAPDDGSVLWLDLTRPTHGEMAALAERFALHPLAVEDALRGHQRPKLETYDGFLFLVFYAVTTAPGKQGLRTSELRIFAGSHFLITLHDEPLACLDEAERRWTRAGQQLAWGTGVLLYSLLDTTVDQYFPVADELVERVEALSERIFAGRAREARFTYDLLELKHQMLAFRRLVAPERDALNVLTNRESSTFHEQTLIYFRDVQDHLARLAETLDLYRDQLTSTMDASLSIASNELNRVMRTLTATSIILMSGALIAGIYGMNFDVIPELHWRYGYFWALGLIATVSLLLWGIFKRMRWF